VAGDDLRIVANHAFLQKPMQPVTPTRRFSQPQLRIDILSVAILLLFLWGWHWRVAGYLSPVAGASLMGFLAMCMAYGSIFTRLIAPLFHGAPGVPFQVLAGYFLFNSLLFLVALCSPFGMVFNLAMLFILALIGLVAMRQRALPDDTLPSDHLAGCLAMIVSCIGATICCNDIQVPGVQEGSVIYKVWSDVFIHVREISVFAQAHGIGSIQDIKLAGGRAPIYHFASYLSPAAISVVSGATAMQVYASLQLPLGIALTGLAAFCFMGKLFGWGPGIAATVAVVLIPDAFQQGFQIRYLSYNFMAQVNLGMLYGIAAVAMAWMFMIDGCRRGKYSLVLLAYGFLAVCLFYKAHLFVANSYVMLMYPLVFFVPLRLSWRIGMGLIATAVFSLVVMWSQSIPRVPTLRLDGSGIGRYLVLLLAKSEPGWIREEFTRIFIQEKHSLVVQAFFAAVMLLLSTFGFWVAGLAVALGTTWRKMPMIIWSFPIIVVGNYLLTSIGLAGDEHGVGSPDELLNRPLVWAYFAVAAWTAAVAYRTSIGTALPRGGKAAAAMLVCALSVGAALYSAPNLQTYPQYQVPTFATGAVPGCLVEAARYLRLHSAQSDVVQESAADPRFRLAALAERQLYVGEEPFGGVSKMQEERLADVTRLKLMSDPKQIREFFATRRIDWYLQRPETELAWPMASLPHPSFSCGGFKLFQFVRTMRI
jgi:hypothetical protein